MAEFFTDAAFKVTCPDENGDRKFIVCDTTAGDKLCCLLTTDGVDSMWYQVAAPCGPLLLTIENVAENDPANCDSCPSLNDDWEIPQGTGCHWVENFADLFAGNCSTNDLDVTVDVLLAYDSVTDEAVLYADILAVYGSSGARVYIELDRQPFVADACIYFDWRAPTDSITCPGDDLTDCGLTSNVCEGGGAGDACDWTAATFTIGTP